MRSVWWTGAVMAACAADPGSEPPAVPFELFEPPPAADVRTDRLCDEAATWDDPSAEKIDITCRFDGGRYADPDIAPKDALVVMAWNLERNYAMEAQEAFIRDLPDGVPFPDVLLVSEVDRGCERSAEVDGARRFAEAGGYDYVFGVEFTELPRDTPSETFTHPCEHGQAIFSRYPIGNVGLFRHPDRGYDPWDGPSQPRLGTRADLYADIRVGDALLRVVSVHYDDLPTEQDGRTEQAVGTGAFHADSPVPVVLGGDMNTFAYFGDLSPTATTSPGARALWSTGWVDLHNGLPDRLTVPFGGGDNPIPAVVDLMWMREADASRSSDPGQCPVPDCGDLSDHMPVWATIDVR